MLAVLHHPGKPSGLYPKMLQLGKTLGGWFGYRWLCRWMGAGPEGRARSCSLTLRVLLSLERARGVASTRDAGLITELGLTLGSPGNLHCRLCYLVVAREATGVVPVQYSSPSTLNETLVDHVPKSFAVFFLRWLTWGSLPFLKRAMGLPRSVSLFMAH